VYSSDTWTFAGNTNYHSASGTITDTIRRVDLTLTADDKQMRSGDPVPDLTYTITSGNMAGRTHLIWPESL
jgi:hypothetical protein